MGSIHISSLPHVGISAHLNDMSCEVVKPLAHAGRCAENMPPAHLSRFMVYRQQVENGVLGIARALCSGLETLIGVLPCSLHRSLESFCSTPLESMI